MADDSPHPTLSSGFCTLTVPWGSKRLTMCCRLLHQLHFERAEQMKRLPSRCVLTKVVPAAAIFVTLCGLSTALASQSPLGDKVLDTRQKEEGKIHIRTAPHVGKRDSRVVVFSDGKAVRVPAYGTKPYTGKFDTKLAGSYTNTVRKSRSSRSNGGAAIGLIIFVVVVMVVIGTAASSHSKGRRGGGGGFFFGGGCGGGCGGGGCGGGGCGGGCGGG